MAGFNELSKEFKKDFGENIGGEGYHYPEMQRIPSGFFPFDLATSGGIPMGRFIELYGLESSCKTNFSLKFIANMQQLYPDRKNALFDAENAFDPKWARQLGVDVDKLYVFKPDYGEQAIDMTEALLGSPECGLVVLDSLAGLATTRELGQSGEQSDVGGAGLLASKYVRKVTSALSRAEKEGRNPTFLCINQVRSKIGTYGNPETSVGGHAPKFAASMRIRLHGKDVKDTKYHKSLPVKKTVNVMLKKWKCPIINQSCEVDFITVPHKGLKIGECDDFGLLKKYMELHGILEKNNSSWTMDGTEYKTLLEIRELLRSDIVYANKIRQAIIETEAEKALELEE